MSTYLYDAGWRQERERLAGIESLWDPGTIRQMEVRGVAEGWTCLEVGGGGRARAWSPGVGPTGDALAS